MENISWSQGNGEQLQSQTFPWDRSAQKEAGVPQDPGSLMLLLLPGISVGGS